MKRITSLLLLAAWLLPLVAQALPFVPTDDPTSPTTHWYQIKMGNYDLYCSYGDLYITRETSTADSHLWCFVGDETTGYKIFNRESRYYLKGGDWVSGLGNEGDIDLVEPSSGNYFYIYYMVDSYPMYVAFDTDYESPYGERDMSSATRYTVNEVSAGTLPSEPSAEPNLSCTTYEDRCVIQAGGYGTVHLYVNNEEVNSPYTIMRTNADQQVTAKATLQQPGRLMSTVTNTFTIPKKEAIPVYCDVTGDGLVDIDDVNAVINIMVGKVVATAAGDVTNDGMVDIADLNEIINTMLGKNAPVFTEYTVNGVSFKMIDVEGGTFTMGDDNGGDASPAHQVTLSDYSIGETEVTQELWKAVMGSLPSSVAYDPKKPIHYVGWDDCRQFITKLNQLTGKRFNLPTEAQWEFAARGGKKSRGYTYAGSNNLASVAWYTDNSFGSINPVAAKAPNELGIYDMNGNVFEWCQDYAYKYTSEPQTDPVCLDASQSSNSSYRIQRGGGYYSDAEACVTTSRNWQNASEVFPYMLANDGLRLAMLKTIPESKQPLTVYGYNIPHNQLINDGQFGYANLVDGDRATTWNVVCSTWEATSIDVKSSKAFVPTSYILTTAPDTWMYNYQNPKKWKLYAKANENDPWTVIADVTDGTAAGLGTTGTTDFTFSLNTLNAYQYFRFEVSELSGMNFWYGNYTFSLAELMLMGY